MLKLTDIDGIALNPTITDKLAVMAYNVLRAYCQERGPETCSKCVFYKDGRPCPICNSKAPEDWPDVENEK